MSDDEIIEPIVEEKEEKVSKKKASKSNKDDCKSCGHEKRFHAVPELHVNGTSHCTKVECHCMCYIGGVQNDN
jgi:hypothetical protein